MIVFVFINVFNSCAWSSALQFNRRRNDKAEPFDVASNLKGHPTETLGGIVSSRELAGVPQTSIAGYRMIVKSSPSPFDLIILIYGQGVGGEKIVPKTHVVRHRRQRDGCGAKGPTEQAQGAQMANCFLEKFNVHHS